MLPHVSQEMCVRFKNEGYRLSRFRQAPVTSNAEIIQLAYLDVNRTMRGVDS